MTNKAEIVATIKGTIEELQDKMQVFVASMNEMIDIVKHDVQFQECQLEGGIIQDPNTQDQLSRDEPPMLKEWEFTLLPASMSVIWPILLSKGVIQREQGFSWFEDIHHFTRGKFCDFHRDQEGHSIEECITLRFQVQNMIDTGNFMFRGWKYCDGNLDMMVVPSMRLEYPHMFENELPPLRRSRGVTWNTWDD
ncbi:uncharacterized protein J3R85_002595 [Psidium guajava]|nr:uncharacterized protein J3R85_002595 [Psidium guajava]